MTVSDIIKNTRYKDNLTQEEYADKFGVTRQTVSSWENSKSFPDLHLLIAICNEYNISLDVLLNENKTKFKYQISKKKKNLLMFIVFFSIVFFAISICWYVKSINTNYKYQINLITNDFHLEDDEYTNTDSINVNYSFPKQKIKFLKTDFDKKYIKANYKTTFYSICITLRRKDNNYVFTIKYNTENSLDGKIESNKSIKFDLKTKEDKIFFRDNDDTLNRVIKNMNLYYNKIYNK